MLRGLLFSLLVLAGCREAPREDLVFWHGYRGAEAAALHASVDRFEAAKGVSVRLVNIPADALPNKLSVAIPRGNGPDLFIFAHDRIGDWAETGLLEPLGLWADAALVDRFFRTTVDPLVYRGELYGLPMSFKSLALFYDTTLVDAPPTTTDALVAKAKALRAANPAVWGLGYELDSLYFHAPWLHGFGGRVYADEDDTLALDSPEAAASLAFVQRLVEQEKIVPDELTGALVTSLFRDHKLAFVVNGPWFRGELAGHDAWAVAPLPTVSETGERARPFLGVEGVLLSAKSERKALAFELARWLTSDAESVPRVVEGAQLVANKAAYEDPRVKADPFAGAFRDQVEHTVSLSNRPHMRRVWTPVKDAISQVVTQGRAPSEALGEAVRRIRRTGE